MTASARPETPQAAWDALVKGNHRFVAGGPAHPRQDIERREALAEKQRPSPPFLAALIQDFLPK